MAGKDHFSDAEVSEILLRAAEIQENPGVVSGFSKDDLVKMAAEMGLSRDAVEAAINRQRSVARENPGRSFFGVPVGYEVEYTLPGEIPVERYDMVSRILGIGHHRNGVRQIGNILTGAYHRRMNYGIFTLTPQEGETNIKFRYVPLLPYFLTLHWILIGTLIVGSLLIANGGVSPIEGILGMVAALGVGWAAFAKLAQAGVAKTRELAKEMAQKLQEETVTLRDRLTEQPVTSQELGDNETQRT